MQATLTRDECKLVQASFAQVDPIADRVAASFYQKLFELDPTLAPLFKLDLTVQGGRLMEKLAVAVKGLEDIAAIAPFVRELGRRHAAYGIRVEHYDLGQLAWLWALELGLGPEFRPDVRAAWAAAYALVTRVMIEGAAEVGA